MILRSSKAAYVHTTVEKQCSKDLHVHPGGCRVVVAQWQSTGGYNQTAWVRFPAAASVFFSSAKKKKKKKKKLTRK